VKWPVQSARTDFGSWNELCQNAGDNRLHYCAVLTAAPKKNCEAGSYALHSFIFGLADEAARVFPGMVR
jgi:hypothetical protein